MCSLLVFILETVPWAAARSSSKAITATQPALNQVFFSPRCAPIFFFFPSHQQRQICKRSPVQSSHPRAPWSHQRRCSQGAEPRAYGWECTTSTTAEANTANPSLEHATWISPPTPQPVTPGCPFRTQTSLRRARRVSSAHGPGLSVPRLS